MARREGAGGLNRPLTGLSVVVPAYNEALAIGAFLTDLRATLEACGGPYEVLVVNDGSRDGTAEALAAISWVKTINHDRNRGYGEALKSGIRAAQHESILITDADGTYDPRDIPKLLAATDGAEMVVGARVGPGVKIPLARRPAKWILRALANFLLETRIADLNSGLRIFRRSQAVELFPLLPSGFSFTTTITLSLLSRGNRVVYVPIGYHRRKGSSKIRPVRDTLNFFALIVKTVIFFKPLRVFVPLSLFFLLGGAGLFAFEALAHRRVSTLAVMFVLTGVQLAAVGAIADLIVSKR